MIRNNSRNWYSHHKRQNLLNPAKRNGTIKQTQIVFGKRTELRGEQDESIAK
jgi:hypothetical protein